tara:strand:+ start:298 stop:471 length:174 start_codon:yes stop_codon:yes gene_type:complete
MKTIDDKYEIPKTMEFGNRFDIDDDLDVFVNSVGVHYLPKDQVVELRDHLNKLLGDE